MGGDREEQATQPTEQPAFRHTPVYKNPHHVKGKTIRLSPKQLTPEGTCIGTKWELAFTFDAIVPCEALLHLDNGPLLTDDSEAAAGRAALRFRAHQPAVAGIAHRATQQQLLVEQLDRKSTRLNSSH